MTKDEKSPDDILREVDLTERSALSKTDRNGVFMGVSAERLIANAAKRAAEQTGDVAGEVEGEPNDLGDPSALEPKQDTDVDRSIPDTPSDKAQKNHLPSSVPSSPQPGVAQTTLGDPPSHQPFDLNTVSQEPLELSSTPKAQPLEKPQVFSQPKPINLDLGDIKAPGDKMGAMFAESQSRTMPATKIPEGDKKPSKTHKATAKERREDRDFAVDAGAKVSSEAQDVKPKTKTVDGVQVPVTPLLGGGAFVASPMRVPVFNEGERRDATTPGQTANMARVTSEQMWQAQMDRMSILLLDVCNTLGTVQRRLHEAENAFERGEW